MFGELDVVIDHRVSQVFEESRGATFSGLAFVEELRDALQESALLKIDVLAGRRQELEVVRKCAQGLFGDHAEIHAHDQVCGELPASKVFFPSAGHFHGNRPLGEVIRKFQESLRGDGVFSIIKGDGRAFEHLTLEFFFRPDLELLFAAIKGEAAGSIQDIDVILSLEWLQEVGVKHPVFRHIHEAYGELFVSFVAKIFFDRNEDRVWVNDRFFESKPRALKDRILRLDFDFPPKCQELL